MENLEEAIKNPVEVIKNLVVRNIINLEKANLKHIMIRKDIKDTKTVKN